MSDHFDISFDQDITEKGQKAASLIEMTMNNEIQMSYLWSSYYEKYIPEIKLLDLPFYFKNKNEVKNLINKSLQPYVSNELIKKNNLKLLGFWDNGSRHISTNKNIIKNQESCKNLKIRTTPSPLHVDVFNELGFISTPLDVRDFKIALKNNDIDAQENPLTNYWNFGVQHKQKYLTLSSHLFGFCFFVINGTFFDELSIDEKNLITQASENTKAYQYELAEEDDKKLIDLIKKENVQIYELTHHEKEQLLDNVKHFHNEFFTKYPNMKF
jgi:TRAP-type C4-dicarboxylate transport system substrate-binding protein